MISCQNKDTSTKVGEASVQERVEKSDALSTDSVALSDAEKQAVVQKASALKDDMREKFGTFVKAWKEAIQTTPETQLSSNTQVYTQLPQFEALKGMGKDIILLIMEELLEQDNFYLLRLYEAVQDDKTLIVADKVEEACAIGSEQERAKRTIRLWLNNQQ